MPRRNRNSEREPINRDRLIDDAVRIARDLISHDPAWVTDDMQFPYGLTQRGGDS
jgi:hypothetical protein